MLYLRNRYMCTCMHTYTGIYRHIIAGLFLCTSAACSHPAFLKYIYTLRGKNNLIKNNLLTSDNDSLEIIWKLFYKQIALEDKNILYSI